MLDGGMRLGPADFETDVEEDKGIEDFAVYPLVGVVIVGVDKCLDDCKDVV